MAKLTGWPVAVRRWLSGRFAASKYPSSLIDGGLSPLGQPQCVGSNIGIDEPDRWIAAGWLQGALDMAHHNCRKADAITMDDPSLCCHISNLVGSNRAGVLDLDKPPAAPAVGFQDIGADYHAVALECCLKDGHR